MQKRYTNKDFYLSAYLVASGCLLTGHSKERGITMFEFEDTEKLHGLVQTYFSMTGQVEPIAFSSAIRSLKSVLHSTDVNAGKMYNNASNNR
jgi:hypothetical protein